MAAYRNTHRSVPQVILPADQRPSGQNDYAAAGNGQGYTNNAYVQYVAPPATQTYQVPGQMSGQQASGYVNGNVFGGTTSGTTNWQQATTPNVVHDMGPAMNIAPDSSHAVAMAMADPFDAINIMMRRISSINTMHRRSRAQICVQHSEQLKCLRELVVSMLRRVSADRLQYIFRVMRELTGQMENNAMMSEIVELAIYDYISVTEDFLEIMYASMSAQADAAIGALARYASHRADLNMDSINLICAWAINHPNSTAFDGMGNIPVGAQTSSETNVQDATVVPEAQNISVPEVQDISLPEGQNATVGSTPEAIPNYGLNMSMYNGSS